MSKPPVAQHLPHAVMVFMGFTNKALDGFFSNLVHTLEVMVPLTNYLFFKVLDQKSDPQRHDEIF